MTVIGHKKQIDFLKKSAALNKLSHAYLFSGQEKLGKKTVALQWVCDLLKIENGGERPHPDLILVSAAEKEIKIEQIKGLIWQLSLKPYSAPFKVALIDNAHLMNQEAQNALLKTLEEPGESTLLILISEYPGALLPTITSRCERINFYQVQKSEMLKWLKIKVSPEEAEQILLISAGRPGVAQEFLDDPQKLKDYRDKIKEIDKVAEAGLSLRFQYAKDLSASPELIGSLDMWLSHFRQAMLERVCGGKDDLPEAAIQPSLKKIKNTVKNIQKIKYLISATNVNTRLALETLMISL
jgi:DNA polymerase-3 subunit delta'